MTPPGRRYRPLGRLLAGTLLVLAGSATALGCIARINAPDWRTPERYAAIFTATVVAIEWVPSPLARSDLVPPYRVTLAPAVTALHGSPPDARQLTIATGCATPVPRIGDVGIFFQWRPGTQAQVLEYGAPNTHHLAATIQRIRQATQRLHQPAAPATPLSSP